MGITYSSTEDVKDPTFDRATFNSFRLFGIWPTRYESNKTPVTVDVLEAGLILAFVMVAFCFFIILPGIRGREKWFTLIRVVVSLLLGACVILCNWGQEWEVDHIHTETHYRAFTNATIKADVGIKIGLRNVNITLKGTPVDQANERIDYNERFWWSFPWNQGRIGFGPYSGEINQEFREAQYKGLPYPILWIAEYFTFDGEGVRWGRHYRTAGWYTHIMLWTAFPLWILANMYFFFNPRIGALLLVLMGFLMIVGNLCWRFIRNPFPLQIPFEEGVLTPKYGWCFWLNLIAGCVSMCIGAAILAIDRAGYGDSVLTFFGVDVLKDYEEFYPPEEEEKPVETIPDRRAKPGHSNGGGADGDPESSGFTARPATTTQPIFRKRGPTRKAAKRPVAPPRAPPRQPIRDDDDNGLELYVNAPNQDAARVDHINPSFEG